MAGYEAALREHARLAMLRFMADAPEYTTNVSLLSTLLPDVGIALTRDQIVTEAWWLDEQGLAEIECHPSGLMVLTATQRGVDASQGKARVPGVARPRPGV